MCSEKCFISRSVLLYLRRNHSPQRYSQPGSPARATVATSGSIAHVYHSVDHMAALMAALSEVDGARPGRSVVEGHPTLGEWWFWVSRCLAILAALMLVVFLFLHDY
jgi:hypothetical protein